MANLNLSEFTEKLFVADADHTFIWDTAASISKRVSRNSWLNSGTLTSDAPVTISQTWNNAAVAFTGLKVNAAGTSDANSASGSLLADFQVNAASKVSITKTGAVRFGDGGFEPGIARVALGTVAVSLLGFSQNHVSLGYYGGASNSPGVTVSSLGHFAWSSSATNSEATRDTILLRDGAANTLALRNGANTQTFNVYGSYGSISDYKRLSISCDQTTGNATITNQAAGYTAGTVSINGVPVGLGKGNFSGNVAIGTGVLNANTTGTDNVAVGFEALALGTGNFETVAIGWKASRGSGARNTAIGYGANQLGAGDSVSIGWASMYSVSGGSLNVAVGRSSGYFITGGSTPLTSCTKSLFLGCDTKALGQSQENQIVIGYDATGIGSNSVVLGNDSITKTALKGNVGIGTTSPTSKLHVYLNPANNYTTETVKFGNIHFGNGTGDYSNIWIGSIATPLTLSASNYTLANDGTNTIINGGSGGLFFHVGASAHWNIQSTGHLLCSSDNSRDIGANGANRPRNVYAGTSVRAGNMIISNNQIYKDAGSGISFTSNGVIKLVNYLGTDFISLQLGGDTDAFPAIARDGAGIKFTGAAAGSTAWIKVPPVAVTSLPDATVAGVGARAFVNDALSPVFGNAVANGGSAKVPVYSDGSAWYVG